MITIHILNLNESLIVKRRHFFTIKYWFGWKAEYYYVLTHTYLIYAIALPRLFLKKKPCMHVLELIVCSITSNSATPWTVARQALLSMEFSMARLLGWVAISFSNESSQPRNRTHIFCLLARTQIWPIRVWYLPSHSDWFRDDHVIQSEPVNVRRLFRRAS